VHGPWEDYGGTVVDPSQVTPAIPAPPPGFKLVPSKDEVLKDPNFQGLPEEERRKVLTKIEELSPNTRTVRTLWLAGILLMPPAVGYGVFFIVVPWIYRGFKPAKQI
jgi:hypothetical protein